jgi:hypothetical protein
VVLAELRDHLARLSEAGPDGFVFVGASGADLLIYQHASRSRDKQIAEAISQNVRETRRKGHDNRNDELMSLTQLTPSLVLTRAYVRSQLRGDEGTRTLNPRRAKRDPPH